MRRVLVVLGVAVLSLPLLFVLWLLLAVRLPRMDSLTMKLPMDVRTTVAEAALPNVSWGKEGLKGITRVIALDPENGAAWGRLCRMSNSDEFSPASLASCQKAVSLEKTAGNWNSLGMAQEKAGDECAAEDSFTQASSEGSKGTAYLYVENMGRAALRCGKAYDARAGLQAALDLEGKSLNEPDQEEDEIADEKQDQLTDREYLIVTFDRLHDEAHARSVCSDAHPDWKGCGCSLDTKGKVLCVDVKP